MSQIPEQKNDSLEEQGENIHMENIPQQSNNGTVSGNGGNPQTSGGSNRSAFGTSNQSPQQNNYHAGEDVESQTIKSDRSIYSDDSSGLLSLKLPQVGYRRLATKMGRWDSEISLFRKFGDLNMFNLLSLQAELMDLRLELDQTCRSDDKINEVFNASRKYAFSFRAMRDAMPKDDGDEESSSLDQGGTSSRPVYDANGVTYCCACKKKREPLPAQIQRGDNKEWVDNDRTDQLTIILRIREKLKEYSAWRRIYLYLLDV
jgi:uncharacterized protein DUF6594